MARKYARDNRGRFASKGAGATARGSRLKTAGGNKRDGQTIQAKGGPKGTIGKPKGLKPGAAKTSGGKWMPVTNSKGQVVGMRDRTKPAPSAAAVAQAARSQRANRNLNAAMKREADGPGSKASRSASVAKRAAAIYAGKVDAKQKTGARLTKTNNAEALRKRVKKIKDNNAAKPAAKPAAKGRGQVSSEKALRVSQRINAVTNAASTKSGVKRLNATEVGVRAKAFATRKVGGMSGAAGMNFQQQQAAVRAGLSKPARYSTLKPNRNKPGAYNQLGQTEQRRRLKAADSIMRNSMPTAGRAGNAGAADTARQIAASANKTMAIKAASVAPQARLATKASGAKAPNNARTQANRLRTTQNRVRYLRQEPDSPKFKKAAAARDAALKARTPGTPGKVVFRSKNRARSRQNMQANDINTRVRYNLKNARPGMSSATGGGGRTGVRRIDTGNRQLSLMGGKGAKLFKTKRVSVSRPSGKSRKFYR